MNSIKTLARPRARHAARSLSIKPQRVPFSAVGIIAVLCCPIIFSLDAFSDSRFAIGVVYMVMMALLSNEKNILILLVATLSSIFLLIDLRLFYGEPDTELAVADKLVAIPAIWLFVYGLLRIRKKQNKTGSATILRLKQSHVPVCDIKVAMPISERIASPAESKNAFKHMRSSSTQKIDSYTHDLVYFIYAKMPKN